MPSDEAPGEAGRGSARTIRAWRRTLDGSWLSTTPSSTRSCRSPRPRSGWVSRSDIIASARASECRVVGVTAPAGYGKTTLLAEWAGAEDRPVGWASLDRFDDDPVRAALAPRDRLRAGRARPRATWSRDVSGMGMSVLGRAAPRLASAFRTAPTPFVVMVDDLHEVQSPACHDALGVALTGIPPGSQLVAASRSDQPHLPSLRASGDALELGMDALALDATGAERVFSGASVRITADLAAMVTERTEGWPVGLYLAAMIARDGGGETAVISGDDRYVADYLYRESLQRLPDDDQRFLRRTAVLDQLCAPLCDAVVGEPGAQERLRRSRRRTTSSCRWIGGASGTATTRCSASSSSVRFAASNPTWSRSSTSAPPTGTRPTGLRRRPSSTCSTRASASAAPTCSAPWSLRRYASGQTSTVFRWLAEVGAEAIEQYPPLGGPGRLGVRDERAASRGGAVGRLRRLCVVRRRALRWHRLVRVGPRHAALVHVRAPVRSAPWLTPTSRLQPSHPGALGAIRRSAYAVKPSCSWATPSRRGVPSRTRSPLGARTPMRTS